MIWYDVQFQLMRPYLHDASANMNVLVSNASRHRRCCWLLLLLFCFFKLVYTADNAGAYDSCGHRRCWTAAASWSYYSRRCHAKPVGLIRPCVCCSRTCCCALWFVDDDGNQSTFSVDDFILDCFSHTAATPQANASATGTAGQQRPRAPTTPAGTAPSR